MASWLFVPIQKDGATDPRLQSEIQVRDLVSHATRFSHAQRRQKKLKALKGSRLHFPVQAAKPERSSSSRDDDQQEPPSTAALPHPQTLLSQSKTEPFYSEELRKLPPVVRQGLEYGYEVLWPTNSPALQDGPLRATIDTWRRSSYENPLHFYSMVSNAASLCMVMSTDPTTIKTLSTIRILYQCKAIQLIKEALGSLKGPPPTALISCIMNVHGQGALMIERVRIDAHVPESPIFKGFNLKQYGRFEPPREHFPALIYLIRQRGGLTALAPGTANPMQLADLCGANITLKQPNFALLPTIAQVADREKDEYDQQANHLLARLGQGFRLRDHGSDLELSCLLCRACKLTACIDEVGRDAPGKLSLRILATKAIAFQHCMLCLPSTSTADAGVQLELEPGGYLESDVYRITRLTTFIYSDFVIFPTAEERRGRQRLARQLKDVLLLSFQNMLDDYYQPPNSPAVDHLILWALVLGGVAAFDSADREWYVAQVFEHVSALDLTFNGLHAILETFLYYDYVFGEAVMDLWDEAFTPQNAERRDSGPGVRG